jgi:outer membrane protein assembly factor BamB
LLLGSDLDGNIFALDPDTGAEEWTFKADGPVVNQPAIGTDEDGEQIAYFASEDTNLYILFVKDGTRAAAPAMINVEFTTRFLIIPTGTDSRSVPLYASPIIYDEFLLVGVDQGNAPLYALDLETLLERWAFNPAGS